MEVTRILRDLSQEKNILIIMISHDLNIAAKYSDTMIMLHGGYIYAIGTPSEVLTKENIKAVYDVESEVIESYGRPHLIMLDHEFDGRDTSLPPGTYASKDKRVD
jgi:iron complex transport system ATP-binding protein